MTYDYECSTCGKRMEIIAKMDEIDQPCPACKRTMRRLISAGVGFIMPHQWGIDNRFGGNYDDLSEKDKITFRKDHCDGSYFEEG